MNADPRVSRWLTPTGAPISHADTVAQLDGFRRHWEKHGIGPWAVEERETGALVGRLGLKYHRLWPDDLELGWKLDPAVWGRGYATEGGVAGLRYAFETLGLDRVVSIVHPGNTASIRVAERLGERLYAHVEWPERACLLDVYAIGRDQWRDLQSTP